MRLKKHLMYLLISLFFYSCNGDQKNLNWLIENAEGDRNELNNLKFTYQYFDKYVYITSGYWNDKYGYLFMDRSFYDNLYDKKNEFIERDKFIDNSRVIVQGKLISENQFKIMSNLLINLKSKRGKQDCPHLFKIDSNQVVFSYYEKNHYGIFNDTIVVIEGN